MAISLGDLKNIDLKQANRVAPVVLLLLILYLCWKLAAMFWLLIAGKWTNSSRSRSCQYSFARRGGCQSKL